MSKPNKPDKTRVEIAQVPLFPDDPVRQQAVEQAAKDVTKYRQTAANRSRAIKESVKPYNERRRQERDQRKAFVRAFADRHPDLSASEIFREIRTKIPHIKERTIRRYLQK